MSAPSQAVLDAWIKEAFGVDPGTYPQTPGQDAAAAGTADPGASAAGSADVPTPVHMRNANERRRPHDDDDDDDMSDVPTRQVKGDKETYVASNNLAEKVKTLVGVVSGQARGNASGFAIAVGFACSDFNDYASEKLEDLKKDEEHIGELIGAMAMIVSGGVEAVVAEKIAEGLGKELAKVAFDALKDQIVANAKKLSKSDSVADLSKAVTEWAATARNMATAAAEQAEKMIVKPLSRIQEKIRDGDSPSKQDDAFLMQFMDLTVPETDHLLARYGIPDSSSAKKVRLKIYGDLVARFEEYRIKADTPSGIKMEWAISGVPPRVMKQARATANGLVKQKGEDIDKAMAKQS